MDCCVELSTLAVLNNPKELPTEVIKLPTLVTNEGLIAGIFDNSPIKPAAAAFIGNARLSPNAFLSLGSILKSSSSLLEIFFSTVSLNPVSSNDFVDDLSPEDNPELLTFEEDVLGVVDTPPAL